jgi:hypothetical protein
MSNNNKDKLILINLNNSKGIIRKRGYNINICLIF